MGEVPRELLAKLPRTFVPAINEQMRNRHLLFPAEQRTLDAQLDWLARLPDAALRELFDPLKQIEARMELPRWNLNAERLTITDTGILVRSPYYPQWRARVAQIFEQIEAGVQSQQKTTPANRLVLCVLPAGLPLPSAPIWPRLEKQGRWVTLDAPCAAMLETFAGTLVGRPDRADVEPVERTWALEYESRLTDRKDCAPACVLSFQALGAIRREFLLRLNAIHKDLRSADAAFEDLRRMDFHKLASGAVGQEERIREFVRNLFLSGNGSMLFGNSFVQWGASEVIRRVQPQALLCCFGIRPKLKPFSSVVLFEDQNRANPVADEPDPQGSMVDIVLLAEYVYLSASQHATYAGRTVFLFAVPEWSRVLMVAPPGFPLLAAGRLAAAELAATAARWLA